MADLLSGGVSAEAFVEIAGRILHGCEYVCSIMNDIREVPEDLQHFGVKLQMKYCLWVFGDFSNNLSIR